MGDSSRNSVGVDLREEHALDAAVRRWHEWTRDANDIGVHTGIARAACWLRRRRSGVWPVLGRLGAHWWVGGTERAGILGHRPATAHQSNRWGKWPAFGVTPAGHRPGVNLKRVRFHSNASCLRQVVDDTAPGVGCCRAVGPLGVGLSVRWVRPVGWRGRAFSRIRLGCDPDRNRPGPRRVAGAGAGWGGATPPVASGGSHQAPRN